MNILFVCMGNICRSPTVEEVARQMARREAPGLTVSFDSAGTAGYHIGEAPDPRSQRHARARGYDISHLRARQLEAADFSRFDLLLAMDADNLAAMRRIAPSDLAGRARMFLHDGPAEMGRPVPDPYYGGPADFEIVIDLAEQGARELFKSLERTAN